MKMLGIEPWSFRETVIVLDCCVISLVQLHFYCYKIGCLCLVSLKVYLYGTVLQVRCSMGYIRLCSVYPNLKFRCQGVLAHV